MPSALASRSSPRAFGGLGFPRRHLGAGGEDEEVVVEAASGYVDAPRVGIDARDAAADELDVSLSGRPRERNQQRLELASERDVDRVRLEQEVGPVAHERDASSVAELRP